MNRNKQIDLMLAFGIIMVVMGHNYQPLYLFFPAYSFHVPLFFFISGYFLQFKFSLKEKNRWLLHKIRTQFVPFWCLNLFFALLTHCLYFFGLQMGQKFDLMSFLIGPFTYGHQYYLFIPSWFLLQLFLSNAILQYYIWHKRAILITFLFIFIAMAFHLYVRVTMYHEGVLLVTRHLMAMFFILSGHLFRSYEHFLRPILLRLSTCILLFLLVHLLNVHYAGLTYSIVEGTVGTSHVVAPIITTLCIILLVYSVCHYATFSVSENSFLYKVGQRSFAIMIWHPTVFFLVNIGWLAAGKIYLGDISKTHFYAYQPEKFWLFYQLPAVIVPVLVAEWVSKKPIFKLGQTI